MAVPDYQSLMLPVLKLSAEGEIRVPVAADVIADRLGLSDEDREAMLPSGRQKLLHNRIHWAKFYLNKAGLIDIPRRGFFEASDTGRTLLSKGPEKIDVEFLKTIPKFGGVSPLHT
jgi:restriction system protein